MSKAKGPNILNFKDPEGLVHHGMCTGEFKPRYIGTDYFLFYHTPCKETKTGGLCDNAAVLVDNTGRIIFNLKCGECGAEDALKTKVGMWAMGEKKPPVEKFHLSARAKKSKK